MPPKQPRCPYCNAQGLKNLEMHQTGAFAVIYCAQCGAIYGVVSLPRQPSVSPHEPTEKTSQKEMVSSDQLPETDLSSLKKPLDFIVEVGNADLSAIEPYSPERMAAAIRAAGYNRNTMYRQFIFDDGPPFCLDHHVEMQQFAIPGGYKNSYKLIWICPEYDCREWELVE